VTAGAYGHHVAQSLAFAYVDPAYAAPGRTLDVMILGEPRTARVLERAMYDPDNHRPRM
jgi:dimethylglycine dehydrogenase